MIQNWPSTPTMMIHHPTFGGGCSDEDVARAAGELTTCDCCRATYEVKREDDGLCPRCLRRIDEDIER